MFELALSAQIPIISVLTNDLPNLEAVLNRISGFKVVELPSATHKLSGKTLYYTFDTELVSVKLYNRLMESEHQLIVINPKEKNSLIFEGGLLATPIEMVKEALSQMMAEPMIEPLLPVLKGLSLKDIGEIVTITQAKYQSCLPSDIKKVRTLLKGLEHGLYQVDTEYDFYEAPKELEEWLSQNENYFINANVPEKLVPRGLLFAGAPGTGKSMGAKAVANHFGIPLYRLDISTVLNKYQGETENRVARILASLEQEAPAVLLIDEVEKIFADSSGESTGVITRVLSQLLWWLAEHRSRIITIMTTNDRTDIPPELYRPGRIDAVLEMPLLDLHSGILFAKRVYASVAEKAMPTEHTEVLYNILQSKKKFEFAHAEVTQLVYFLIKKNKWL